MATEFLNIIPSKYAEASQSVQYTVSSPQNQTVKLVIDSFTVSNTGTSAATFSCNIVDDGNSADPSNEILPTTSIQPDQAYLCPELVGQTLEDGQFISTLCDTANALVIRASGRLITT